MAGPGSSENGHANGDTNTVGSGIGVSYIDLLFGIVVGQVFTGLANARLDESGRTSHLILALATVTFSWIAYHHTKVHYLRDLEIGTLAFGQFVVDIGILGLYFALAQEAMGEKGALIPEAWLLAAIFAAYFVWDCFQYELFGEALLTQRDGQRKWRSAMRAMGPNILMALIFVLIAAGVHTHGEPKTETPVVGSDAALLVVMYLYRRLHWPGMKAFAGYRPPDGLQRQSSRR